MRDFNIATKSRFIDELGLNPTPRQPLGSKWSYLQAKIKKADDLETPSRSSDPLASWRVGEKVKHPTLGIGVVQGFELGKKGTKLTILFHEHGQKVLIDSFVTKLSSH